jgi:hypothetical protein
MARAALTGLLVCLLVLAGCATLADLGQLREDLDSAGYDATSINHNTTNGISVLSIDVSTVDEPTYGDAERIAEVAWTTYPGEIDRMEVSINGSFGFAEDYDDLLVHFGERPEGMAADDAGGSPLTLIVVVVGVAVVFAALMVLLWRRGRRPPPPVAAPPGHQPGGHFQYPPQPPQG